MKRRKKIAFLSLQDIWFDEEQFLRAKESLVALHTNQILPEGTYDFRLTAKTFLADLTPEQGKLLQGKQSKTCRHQLRKASQDGVRVYPAKTKDEVDEYLAFQKQFCREKGIPDVNEGDLDGLEIFYAVLEPGDESETSEETIWPEGGKHLCRNGKEEYLGGCAYLVSEDGKTARYKYGATAHAHSENEAIMWYAMCHYKALGCENFDFGGVIPTEDRTSYYFRHYEFKKKFGGTLIDSYTYFRIRGIWKPFYWIFKGFVRVFFKGDVNGFTVWLGRVGLLK